MAQVHVYFGVENLNLNVAQRGALVDALEALGPANHPQPACRCHWRTRLDGDAGIYEALFDENDITVTKFKERLGTIFSVDPSTIDHAVSDTKFNALQTAVVTFSRGGVDYLRAAFFGFSGGAWPGWKQSGDECRAYLALNKAEWEEE